jgi:hypothetical protein
MRKILMLAAVAALSCAVMASGASADPIRSACMKSDRKAANARVCGCLQQVADMTLRSADQKRAAKFFTDPDKAQEVRMSTSDRDNEFWDRYKNFGETAEAYCAG